MDVNNCMADQDDGGFAVPQARSFQMMTMGMQRANPPMISPVLYSGRYASRSPRASLSQSKPAAALLPLRSCR
jgi:hypothetical protein